MAADELLEIRMEAFCQPVYVQRVQNDRFSHATAEIGEAAALAAANFYHISGAVKAAIPDFFNTYLSFHSCFLSFFYLWLTFRCPELILEVSKIAEQSFIQSLKELFYVI